LIIYFVVIFLFNVGWLNPCNFITCVSGVTRNSGAPGQISSQALSPLSLPSLPLHFCPISILPYPFPSFPIPSRPFLPLPLLSTISNKFLPFPSLSPIITARDLGSAIAPPRGFGRSPATKRIFVQFTAPNLQIC